ncbi:non-ribosomal peptide synthetase [Nocardiopsis quinghaiensis]|uniref:non-ribosomal peptide synthetase n=1 Tax=Nocardiopsis quinghaiensis TaxID=464995 RepID=UPI00123C1D21|nr:non-ribosomal peptide synthetase [Nocardiopsis quinghaiensis]
MEFEPVHETVSRIAREHSDRTAIEGPGGRTSYAELDAGVRRLSTALAVNGVEPGSMVPVIARDRTLMATALLAVLRTGGVVVPLDVAGPPGRVAAALRATSPGHVITDVVPERSVRSLIEETAPEAKTVTPLTDPGPQEAPAHASAPDDPCYVFFTSGTTGRPKGIVGRVGSVPPYLRWESELVSAGPGSRVSQLHSPGFDAVLRDVLLPLTTGGTLCLPEPGIPADPAALCRWIDDSHVTLVHCVPTVFRGFLAAAEASGTRFASLRHVALSGERLHPSDVARWTDLFGADGPGLINMYGPSETTMTKTYHLVTPADAERETVPVGRPVPGTEVLLLDEYGGECPTGEVGEVHLRTRHGTLGYLNDPDATESSFERIPGGGPGEVVYRTGDFGRLLPDDGLEFLGRTDHQVKVGGVRVEVEGVEALLREVPGVEDAAVTVTGEGPGPLRLRAFLQCERLPDASLLRDRLAHHLPGGALPEAFARLDRLPRTISGKVDRQALPTDIATAATPAAVEPRTPLERVLAAVWSEILPLTGTDVRRSFFDAGGSSLLVLELLTRIRRQTGAEVPLASFLVEPTIESAARLVEESLFSDETMADLFDDEGEAEGLAPERHEHPFEESR